MCMQLKNRLCCAAPLLERDYTLETQYDIAVDVKRLKTLNCFDGQHGRLECHVV